MSFLKIIFVLLVVLIVGGAGFATFTAPNVVQTNESITIPLDQAVK